MRKQDLSNLAAVAVPDSRGPLENDEYPVDDNRMQIRLIDQMLAQAKEFIGTELCSEQLAKAKEQWDQLRSDAQDDTDLADNPRHLQAAQHCMHEVDAIVEMDQALSGH